jgi:hypothetical protein
MASTGSWWMNTERITLGKANAKIATTPEIDVPNSSAA